MKPPRPGIRIWWAMALSAACQAGPLSVPCAAPALAEPNAPLPPRVGILLTRNPQPEIYGSWVAAPGARLTVEVAGRTYRLGEDAGLTADGQTWTLVPQAPLADGVHDVAAVSVDAAGRAIRDETRDELEVDSTPPPPPAVNPYAGSYPRPLITGTWPRNEAISLAVTLAGRTYVLGIDRQLVGNERGDWSLIPAEDVEPGTYDVVALAADRAGNTSRDTTTGEVVVAASALHELPGSALACQSAFDTLLSAETIYFAENEAIIEPASLDLIRRLAEAARGCPDAEIEIVAHAGPMGLAAHQQALGERRAAAVLDALASEGIERDRLTARGNGGSRLPADDQTARGWAKGRPVEFVVRP